MQLLRPAGITLLCLLLLFCPYGHAQSQRTIDSMERLLPAQKDTALINSYCDLALKYRYVDRAKAMAYAQKAIQESRRIHFRKGEGFGLYYYGFLSIEAQHLDTALEYFTNSLEVRRQINDRQGMGKAYLKMSTVNQMLGKFDKTLDYAQRGLRLFEEIKDEQGTGDALYNLGVANESFGNVDAALKYYNQALQIRIRANDIVVLATNYAGIGNIYYFKKDYSRAKDYYIQADSFALLTKDYINAALVSHNLAVIYDETGSYKEGLDYAETSYSLREQQGNTKGMVSTLNIWGSLLTRTGNYKLAEEKLLMALKLADTLSGGLPEKHRIYRTLTRLYEAKGDFRKALEASKQVVVYNDSLYATDVNEKLSEMEIKYQTSVKDQQIQKQRFEISKRNYFIGGICLLIILGAMLAYSYYRRFRLNKERQLQTEIIRQQDLASKGIIEAEERERQRIAVDLHDGLGQLFSAVRMNMNIIGSNIQFKDDETAHSFSKTLALVDESCKEVRSISHQMMPNTLLKYGLVSAVRDFIHNIDTRMLRVNLEIAGLNERLDTNTETVLYRVLQETVNNVIKHAAASQLDIQLGRDEDGVTATIEDNGKGFEMATIAQQDGIGLKNIQTRIEFLKGTVEFDSTPGRGTVVSIWIPLQAS